MTPVRPSRWRTFPWIPFLVMAALVWPASLVDHAIAARVGTPEFQEQAKIPFGGLLALMPFLIFLAILADFPNRARLISGFILALLLSTALTHTLKYAVGRARPHADLGHQHFQPLTWEGRMASFPSGHTTAAMTIAAALGLYFPRGAGVFYLFAACVAFERMVTEAHFLSDVLAGAAIGFGTVYGLRALLGPDFFRRGEANPAPDPPHS